MSVETDKRWYVIHTYSGFEGRVRASIEERARQLGLEEKISRVLVPTEEIIEIKEGKKRTATKKFFPGYVLVEMAMDDDALHLVKDTPKVTGFLGGGKIPHLFPIMRCKPCFTKSMWV